MIKPIPTRLAYGQTLYKIGDKYKEVVVLDADLSVSTQTALFAKQYPERFFNIGIAEQNLIGVASGLALTGKTVFVSSFAVFASGRAWEQIRNTVCYMNLNVKIAATHSGLTVGPDGASHQSLEDIAIMRTIPNMTVLCPADVYQTEKAVMAAIEHNGPVYIRLSRDPVPVLTNPDLPFKIGKNRIKIKGQDGTIFASGITLGEAVKAAETLRSQGYRPRVVNVCSIKPIDVENIVECAKDTGFFITVEDHQIQGGIGSAIAEVTTSLCPVPIRMLGVNNSFGESGTAKNLLKKYGITCSSIIKAYKEEIKKTRICI